MATTTSPFVFATPTLTKIDGKPTNQSLQLLQREINDNAMSIPSQRGDGIHGHLQFVISNAAYLAIANVPFLIPAHPGNAPIHQPNATAAQITETNRQYAADLDEHRHANKLNQALKKQLLEAVDRIYVTELSDPTLGFANRTVRDLLNHLHATYGTITFSQLDENLATLDQTFNPDEPLELLWDRVKECRRFATAGTDPITEITVVRKTLSVLEKTGVFNDAIRDWRKRPDPEWTWTNFKTAFTIANTERERELTAANAGYHSANAAARQTDAIPNVLAEAIAAAEQLTIATNAANNARATDSASSITTVDYSGWHYCWTHGLGHNPEHTSALCTNPAHGHCRDATVFNMQGGNNTIIRKRGERAVFQQNGTRT
jgi:hypothetical protein